VSNGKSVIHAGRHGANRGASRSPRARSAFWRWWQTGPPDPPVCNCGSASLCACIEKQAFLAGWEAATRNEGVDDVHSGNARQEAQVTGGDG